MSRRHKRHGPGGGHGPEGHGPHHQLHPDDPKPPGEVINPPSPTPGEDVDFRSIVRFAIGLLVVTVAASLIIYALMRQLGRISAEQASVAPPGQPRGVDTEYGAEVTRPDGSVRLQRSPFADMDERRRRDEEQLTTYGWVDRPGEVVRVPIDVAKRLVVQRGLPSRTEAAVSAPAIPVLPMAVATAAPRSTPAAPRPTRRPAPRPTATAAPEAAP